jgi:hypothetical protein
MNFPPYFFSRFSFLQRFSTLRSPLYMMLIFRNLGMGCAIVRISLWRACSRLYRKRFLHVKIRFAAFLEIYKTLHVRTFAKKVHVYHFCLQGIALLHRPPQPPNTVYSISLNMFATFRTFSIILSLDLCSLHNFMFAKFMKMI